MGIVGEKAALKRKIRKLEKANAIKTDIISDLRDEIKRVRGNNEFLKMRLEEVKTGHG